MLSPHSKLKSGGPGRVWLVGAGPGDPELLTLKAVRVLGEATLVLVDDLVNPAVLAHLNANARIVHVGKRGGCKSTPQVFIEKLMVSGAQAGETVVRLKGGDPFIFGRGGEEVESLAKHGIDVQIVNGITSGLAAVSSLNVPLTHREYAHGVVLVTGHAKSGDKGTHWASLATAARDAKLTLVIYMGLTHASEIQSGLLCELPSSTPVAIIQNASLPNQASLVTTLGDMLDAIVREGLASPAVVVIGNVLSARLALQQAEFGNCDTVRVNDRS